MGRPIKYTRDITTDKIIYCVNSSKHTELRVGITIDTSLNVLISGIVLV